MKLLKTPCYNPYFVNINDKSYCIETISVFDSNGIIIKSSRGWFGLNNNIPEMFIDCDCVRKLKVDFSCKTAFIVKGKDFTWLNEKKYNLYLPNSVMQLDTPNYAKAYNNTMLRCIMKSTTVNGAVFETYTPIESNLRSIESEITDIGEKISNMYGNFSELEAFANKLIELKKAFDAEQTRLDNLALSDVVTKG